MSDQENLSYTSVGQDGKIFLPKKDLDEDLITFKQIESMVSNPAIHHARVMPDCHAGVGCVIGFTAQLRDKVVPSWIGVDLGCGILTYPLGKLESEFTQKDFAKIDKNIRENVPMGTSGNFTIHNKESVTKEDIELMCEQSKKDCELFVEAYKSKFPDITFEIPPIPDFSYEWLHSKCKKVLISFDRVIKSMGSLGGGNHYIEMNISKEGVYYVTIHCGSRSFGRAICGHHQGKITKAQCFNWADYHKEERKLKKLYKKNKEEYEIKRSEMEQKFKEAETNPVNFLMEEKAFDYFYDAILCNQYAKLNRRVILRNILNVLNVKYDDSQIIESVHNYIDFDDFIIRKGAISAQKDKVCIVSLNMRDGIILCKGKGEEDWNFSCAHGAGRNMSRTDCMRQLKMSQFEADMSGIYSSSILRETLDEAPRAYKDSKMIIDIIQQSVEIIEQLRPVLNIKAIT